MNYDVIFLILMFNILPSCMANLHFEFNFSNYPFPKTQQSLYYSPNINTCFLLLLLMMSCLYIIICSDNRLRTANAGTQNHGMQHDNPAYGQASSEPEYMEIDSYRRPVSQPDVGFRNPHFDPGDHYQSLDNANERPDHTYGRLEITGVRSQSYV